MVLFLCLTTPVFLHQIVAAQEIGKGQLEKAVQRSKASSEILTKVLSAPEKGIPIELIKSAKAVAVFPKVVKAKMLITQATTGYGVITILVPDGWTNPAYYSFRSVGYEFNVAGGEAIDIILLFMNDKAISPFRKGSFDLKGETGAVAGPIGKITPDQRKEIDRANVLGYLIRDGELVGTNVKSNFFKGFRLNVDDNLNKAIYGLKAAEILSGKQTDKSTLPAGIGVFQQTLSQYSGQ